jgi:Ca2+/H+ antiporter
VKIVSVLLLFVPVAVALEYLAPDQHLWVFLASALAIVPCAGWMGKATEALAALVLGQVWGDGQSNWIKGVQLLAVYLILAIVFYFTPGKAPQ